MVLIVCLSVDKWFLPQRESEHWVFPCWQKARKGGGMGEHGGKGSVQEWKGKLGSPFPSGPKFLGPSQCGMG